MAIVTFRPMADPDIWFHMALGREVMERSMLPRADIFSFTAGGREWISSGWASSALFYEVFERFRTPGILWLTFAAVGLAFLTVYGMAARTDRWAEIALVQLGGILAAYMRYTPRPEVWSQVCTALVLLVLATAVRGGCGESPSREAVRAPRRLWFLPVLFVLWANLHAGFLIGLVVVGIYAAWQLERWVRTRERGRLTALIPLALCGVAWMANPYGPRLLALAGKIEAMPHVKDKIYEWMPLWASGVLVLPWPTYAGFGLLCAGFLIVAARSLPARGLAGVPWWIPVTAFLFFAMAVWQRRHTGLAAVALPALLSALILAAGRRPEPKRAAGRRASLAPAAAAAVALGVGAAGIGAMQHVGILGAGRGLFRGALNASVLPVFPTQWLLAHTPPGQMYNTYGAGGYLLYHLGPAVKVFMDGRLDCYDPRTWLDYLAIEDGSIPLADAAQRYDLGTFVLYNRDALHDPEHLVFRLSDDPGWRLTFVDDAYSVFVRQSPENGDAPALQGFRYANPFAAQRFGEALADPARRDGALEELNRLRSLPGAGGAWTPALASMAARAAGSPADADRLLNASLGMNPENPLARGLLMDRRAAPVR